MAGEQQASMRRVCRVLGQRRASVYYKPRRVNEDDQIADRLKVLTMRHLNWGFRLLFNYLRLVGHCWNHKKVYRIYRSLKLNLRKPIKRKKIKRDNPNTLAASTVNQGWSLDFLSDKVNSETQIRILNVMDEFSRKCLLAVAQPSFKARKLMRYLEQMVETYGRPQYIRCDNGPELISKHMNRFAKKHKIEIRYSQPGKPMQNGLVERLNGTLRSECLNLKVFQTTTQLQATLDDWWQVYNFERPHSALRYQTPDTVYQTSVKFQHTMVTV